MYISYWILPLCLVLGQPQLFFCIIPSGRHCVSRVLKENRSRLTFATMVLYALSAAVMSVFFFHFYRFLLCEKEREMTESNLAQRFSVLMWAPRTTALSVSTKKTNVPSENRDLRAKCLKCNREVRRMSHICWLWRKNATFLSTVLWRHHVQFFSVSKGWCVPAVLDARIISYCGSTTVFTVKHHCGLICVVRLPVQ